jgi:hypothetical protein
MNPLLKILFAVSILCLFACGVSDSAVQFSRSADSLSGSVINATAQLRSVDSVLLHKAITRYTYYYAFIEHTVSDTLLKSEADQLLRFMSSGKRLKEFEHNRPLLIERGVLIASQLQRLADDARQQRIQKDALKAYYLTESAEARSLLILCNAQLTTYQSALSEFKTSLSAVEALIRQRNKGELPQVVEETTIF